MAGILRSKNPRRVEGNVGTVGRLQPFRVAVLLRGEPPNSFITWPMGNLINATPRDTCIVIVQGGAVVRVRRDDRRRGCASGFSW